MVHNEANECWINRISLNTEKEPKRKPDNGVILIADSINYLKILLSFLCFFFSSISLTLSCPMDLRLYPLDRQTCHLNMISCKFLLHFTIIHHFSFCVKSYWLLVWLVIDYLNLKFFLLLYTVLLTSLLGWVWLDFICHFHWCWVSIIFNFHWVRSMFNRWVDNRRFDIRMARNWTCTSPWKHETATIHRREGSNRFLLQ